MESINRCSKAGLIKSIGVCNFTQEHIETLERETGVLPAVNQIELHPYFNQKEMIQFNKEKVLLQKHGVHWDEHQLLLMMKILLRLLKSTIKQFRKLF